MSQQNILRKRLSDFGLNPEDWTVARIESSNRLEQVYRISHNRLEMALEGVTLNQPTRRLRWTTLRLCEL